MNPAECAELEKWKTIALLVTTVISPLALALVGWLVARTKTDQLLAGQSVMHEATLAVANQVGSVESKTDDNTRALNGRIAEFMEAADRKTAEMASAAARAEDAARRAAAVTAAAVDARRSAHEALIAELRQQLAEARAAAPGAHAP